MQVAHPCGVLAIRKKEHAASADFRLNAAACNTRLSVKCGAIIHPLRKFLRKFHPMYNPWESAERSCIRLFTPRK